jgi:hypothetical protein
VGLWQFAYVTCVVTVLAHATGAVPCHDLPCFQTSCCLQTGVLGGLQVWDERLGPSPVSKSKNSWGHTGCGLMDKQMSAQRQVRVKEYSAGVAACRMLVHVPTYYTAMMVVVVFWTYGFAYHDVCCPVLPRATATASCCFSCYVWTSTPPGPTWLPRAPQEVQWPSGTSGSSQHPWRSQGHGQQLGTCARSVVTGWGTHCRISPAAQDAPHACA